MFGFGDENDVSGFIDCTNEFLNRFQEANNLKSAMFQLLAPREEAEVISKSNTIDRESHGKMRKDNEDDMMIVGFAEIGERVDTIPVIESVCVDGRLRRLKLGTKLIESKKFHYLLVLLFQLCYFIFHSTLYLMIDCIAVATNEWGHSEVMLYGKIYNF